MEKKNYTLIQNLMYYFNVILEIDSYSILKMCLYAIVQLLVSLVPLLISYFLVLWIENYTVTLSIIVRILLVFSIQGALLFIHLRLQINKTLNAIAVRIGEFGYRLSKHFFNLDYQLLSQSKIYNAYTQALQNGINNNSSGSEAMYHQSMRFLTNALGLTFFMIIMTYHNPFVILISLVSAVLTILSLKMRRDYREKHRNSWAKLEDGIDTFIKDDYNDGVSLSGGEAQKVAISRAWYKDAPLLILDEPTAALDPLSEFEIYNHFNDLMENRTAVYISHRMSASSFSDRIIVFDKGCVCETGTHQELLRANGVYKTLYETQAQYYK